MKPQLIVLLDSDTQQANICVSEWPAKVQEMETLYGPGSPDAADSNRHRWVVPISAVTFHKIQGGN
jgi:hypothetical protein